MSQRVGLKDVGDRKVFMVVLKEETVLLVCLGVSNPYATRLCKFKHQVLMALPRHLAFFLASISSSICKEGMGREQQSPPFLKAWVPQSCIVDMWGTFGCGHPGHRKMNIAAFLASSSYVPDIHPWCCNNQQCSQPWSNVPLGGKSAPTENTELSLVLHI
jgi:hypothetical protein